MKQRARRHGEGEDQVECWTTDAGHVWIHYYDELPGSVRRRLRDSADNLCPACLVTKFLCPACLVTKFAPKVQRQHPNWSREKLLFAAIEVMEAKVKQQEKGDLA